MVILAVMRFLVPMMFGVFLVTANHDAFALDDITNANPTRGGQLVDALGCAECHGDKGRGLEPGWPRLGGQYARYIANQLENFLSGRRPHPFMERYATVLSPQDRIDIARYYACQHPSWAGDASCGQVR